MKSVLYVGATLMIGASIYGFVDYKNTNHRKEFREMYNEKEVTPALDNSSIEDNPVSTKKDVTTTDLPTVAEKETRKSEPAKVEALPAAKKTIVKKNQQTSKVKTFKRKLNYKSFSRAPLREERVYEKTDLPKKKTSSEANKL